MATKDDMLETKYNEFDLGGAARRRFINVNMTFLQLLKYTKIEVYSAITNLGEQRDADKNHVKRLKKAMLKGEFTPCAMSAGLRQSHTNDCKIDHDTKKVILKLDPSNPIPLTDGGHRTRALKEIWDEGDVAVKRKVESCTFPVTIQLDSAYVSQDFLHLQEGLKMDKSHLASLKMASDNYTGEQKQIMNLGKQVLLQLHHNDQSHLFGQIKFSSSDASPFGWESLLKFSGSDLSTSMVTGCRLYIKYKQEDVNLLVNCYTQAYQALRRYGTTETMTIGGAEITEPVILMEKKLLRPMILSGTKGGSRLIVGLGNCLAFRKIYLREQQITPADMEHLARSAEAVLDAHADGNMNTARLRTEMGRFAREYFSDLQGSDMVFRDGVPDILCVETGNSTWGIDVERKPDSTPPQPSEVDEGIETVDGPNGSSDTDPEWHNQTTLSSGVESEESAEPEEAEEETAESLPQPSNSRKGRKGKKAGVNS
jgi:hypothetical protein